MATTRKFAITLTTATATAMIRAVVQALLPSAPSTSARIRTNISAASTATPAAENQQANLVRASSSVKATAPEWSL